MSGMEGFINFNGTLEGSIAGGDSGAVKDVKTNASGSYQSVVDEAGNAMIDLSIYAKETDVSEDMQSLSSQLSNKQNKLDYSTEEQDTGIKWIDGKPLYQKTIIVTSIVSGANIINHNISNIDRIVNMSGTFFATNNSSPIPNEISDNAWSLNMYDFGLTSFSLSIGSNWVQYFDHIQVTMQYTKTTDTAEI